MSDPLEKLVFAVLRWIGAELAGGEGVYDGDERDYAGDLVKLAARELVVCTDAGSADDQPAGWVPYAPHRGGAEARLAAIDDYLGTDGHLFPVSREIMRIIHPERS